MKLMCKCGNVEELKSDSKPTAYEFRDCHDGTIVLVCTNCNAAVFITIKK